MKSEAPITEELIGCATLIAVAPVLLATVYLLEGFVFMKLWGWFVAPTFELVPPITLIQAIGISMTISFVASARIIEDDEDKTTAQRMTRFAAKYYVAPIITLLVGYLVTLFM
jgi:hypothetical protein